jgi:RNA polymerase sigma-70 factor (ECF subfamily)
MLFKNKAEFKEIFESYYNPLCNFVNNYVSDTALAEDIVQDVFLKLWRSRNELGDQAKEKNYLFAAAKNKAFEHLRSRKSYDELIKRYGSSSELTSNEGEYAEKLLKLEALNQSLRHLPAKCRKIFTMHKFNGLTYKEIAEVENISIKTVENHMIKAIKILREKMAN